MYLAHSADVSHETVRTQFVTVRSSFQICHDFNSDVSMGVIGFNGMISDPPCRDTRPAGGSDSNHIAPIA